MEISEIDCTINHDSDYFTCTNSSSFSLFYERKNEMITDGKFFYWNNSIIRYVDVFLNSVIYIV